MAWHVFTFYARLHKREYLACNLSPGASRQDMLKFNDVCR
jgi:hypothetical protein